MDNHEYQCFGGYWNDLATKPEGWETHLQGACDYGDKIEASKHPAFIGEFSLEVTDCQKYLDGGFGMPYVPPSKSLFSRSLICQLICQLVLKFGLQHCFFRFMQCCKPTLSIS